MSWQALIARSLDDLTQSQRLRRRRVVKPLDAVRVEVDGTPLVNFCSNDYLGLSHHTAVIAAAQSAAERYGAGSGAAPLVTGYTPAHASAESAIAHWKGVEAAVLLPSGYQANIAAIQTVKALVEHAGRLRFVADKLVHASLIDALHAAGNTSVEVRFYPHQHHAKLRRLIDPDLDKPRAVCIVTESVFSMDGDVVDLASIASLRRQQADGSVMLLVDEAHATGVFGEAGSGLIAETGLRGDVDISVVTFSKAAGVAGGAVCGSKAFCQALISLGRAYLFSTAPPPSTAAAIEAAIGVMRDEPARQQRLQQRCREVRAQLVDLGILPRPTSTDGHATPIIPIVLGDEAAALAASERLLADGLLVAAIRPPTVPRGTSRLRLTLSSEHTDEQIERLLKSLKQLDLPHP